MGEDKEHLVLGTVVEARATVEAYTFKRDHYNIASSYGKYPATKMVMAGTKMGLHRDLDVSWLSAASDSYKISPDINDYVIVQVPLVTSDVPNRNLQGFAYEELSYFDPLYGRMIYQTFVGKPTYQDHVNSDPLQAKGVNLDASLVPISKYGCWKVMVLSAFDRTKDSYLVEDILKKRRTGYSMGALTDAFLCSVCGHVVDPHRLCNHMKKGKGTIWDGKLAYEMCVGVNFIENSSVESPADVTAVSHEIYQ